MVSSTSHNIKWANIWPGLAICLRMDLSSIWKA